MKKLKQNLSQVPKKMEIPTKNQESCKKEYKISQKNQKIFKNLQKLINFCYFFEKSLEKFKKSKKTIKNIENASAKEECCLGALDGARSGQKIP